MRSLALCAALAAGAAAGALGHAALSQPASREPGALVARGAPPPIAACKASLAPEDLAALRNELATLLEERLGGQPGVPVAPRAGEPEPAPEAVAAAVSAGQVIDAALAQGVWRDPDRSAFRSAIAAMTTAQRDQATSRLLTALNEGHLHREVVGPIF
jgi:hypothetical protein